MTITDPNPTQPAATGGEVVCAHAALVPPRNPYRFSFIASTVVLAGTAVGAITNLDGDEQARGVASAVLGAAFVLWVSFLIRFYRRAEAGDR